jgi:type VI secretion system secreted protein Hcp
LRRLRLLTTSVVVTIFAAFGVVPTAEAAVDYFLEIDGIPGESQDAKQAKSIEVLSFSWGASRASTDKKDVRLQDLSILKNVDVASPPLFQRLAQGAPISSMELLGRKSGAEQQIFLRYCFQDVQVTSVNQSDSRGSTSPIESVNFAYGAFSEQYTRQDPDGSLGQTVFAGWNATAGQLIVSYPSPCGL